MICRKLRVFCAIFKSKTCVCAILLRFSISERGKEEEEEKEEGGKEEEIN